MYSSIQRIRCGETADLSHNAKSVQLGVRNERFSDILSQRDCSKQANLDLS